MTRNKRKAAFVLAASDHGTLIINRLDCLMVDDTRGFGVGFSILENSSCPPEEIRVALSLLKLRRQYFGDGVFAVDCGANIGVHTVEWAKQMTGWGSVLAIEAQERIFYALAGNIAVNNCFNAKAVHAAAGAQDGTLRIPNPDYLRPASFGSLELKRKETNENIGQQIDYSDQNLSEIKCVTVDSLRLARLDLLKIDVEGMEEEVLAGAKKTILAHRPILLIEWIKSSKPQLRQWLEGLDYRVLELGINLVAVHQSDRSLTHIQIDTSRSASADRTTRWRVSPRPTARARDRMRSSQRPRAAQPDATSQSTDLPGRMPTLQLDYAELHRDLGGAFVAQGKLDEAIMYYQWALALRPGDAKAHVELGRAFMLQGGLDQAVVSYERAVALQPDNAAVHLVLCGGLRQRGRLDEAILACRSAIGLRPDDPVAHVVLSSLLLTQGRFQEGWRELEWRLRLNKRNIPETLWQGEDLSGRTLLVWAEQGFGDSIHFSRYLNLFKARGGRILVEIGKPLLKLFQDSFEVDQIFPRGQEQPPFDFHIPFVSLPRVMRTDLNTIPADTPYLRADPSLVECWKQRLATFDGPKIGIVWAGNPEHHRDFARSIPFDVFRRALPNSGIDLFSLQVGPRAPDAHSVSALKIDGISELFTDYADTAAAILNLDLCVTVDTSVAHLAGALARPVWVLIPFSPDCRWLLHREDTPWYPSMRLFRQEHPGDWAPVLDRVRNELAKFVGGDRSVLLPQRAAQNRQAVN